MSPFVSCCRSCSLPSRCAVARVIIGPSGLDFLHFQRELGRRENSLAKENAGEGHDPTFVVGKLAYHFGPERLDATALFLGVDDLVEVEHVGERVAALFPTGELVIDDRDAVRRQSADVVRQALHEPLGIRHCTVLSTWMLAGTTPIIVSRV